MLIMKRTLILLLFFFSFSLFAQNQGNAHLDSLLNLTSKYKEDKLVDLFIEIAKVQSLSNNEQAHRSADEAIRLANQIKYLEGVGKAYLTKGQICNLNNSSFKGIKDFEEAKRVFIQLEDRKYHILIVEYIY